MGIELAILAATSILADTMAAEIVDRQTMAVSLGSARRDVWDALLSINLNTQTWRSNDGMVSPSVEAWL